MVSGSVVAELRASESEKVALRACQSSLAGLYLFPRKRPQSSVLSVLLDSQRWSDVWVF